MPQRGGRADTEGSVGGIIREMPSGTRRSHVGSPPEPADDWDRHWGDYAAAACVNPAQAYRRRLILRALARSDAARRVLDVGCGTGDLAAAIQQAFPAADVVGLDASWAAVELARRRAPSAVFVRSDLSAPAERDGPYAGWASQAVCSEVLEHVEQPRRLLAHLQTYLAPGSLLVVTVPAGPVSAFDRHIGHRRHYTPESLRTLLEEAGFRVERVSRAGFPFFNLYRLAIVLRGERLIEDAASGGRPPPLARTAASLLRALFTLNLPASPWGWQLVALARSPAA